MGARINRRVMLEICISWGLPIFKTLIPKIFLKIFFKLLKPTSFECPTYEGIKKTTKKELENELKIKYKDLFEFVQINVFNSTMPLTLHQVASLNNLNREASV